MWPSVNNQFFRNLPADLSCHWCDLFASLRKKPSDGAHQELCLDTHMLHGAGIFTCIWVIFRAIVLVNIPYMEHMGYVG